MEHNADQPTDSTFARENVRMNKTYKQEASIEREWIRRVKGLLQFADTRLRCRECTPVIQSIIAMHKSILDDLATIGNAAYAEMVNDPDVAYMEALADRRLSDLIIQFEELIHTLMTQRGSKPPLWQIRDTYHNITRGQK